MRTTILATILMMLGAVAACTADHARSVAADGPEAGSPSKPTPACASTTCGGACVDLAADPSHCGACGHDCQGGACVGARCQPFAVATGGNYFGLAVDADAIYAATDDTLYRIPSRGGAAVAIATGQATINDLALDDGAAYWSKSSADALQSGVFRAPKDGSEPPVTVALDENVWDIAIGPNDVYWSGPDAVRYAPRTGGTPTTFGSARAVPFGIGVDATSVFWCEVGPLDADSGGGSVWRWSPGTDAPVALTTGENQSQALALDDANIFFTTAGTVGARYGDGAVKMVSKTGGDVVEIASGQAFPFAIAVDAHDVYWGNVGETSRDRQTDRTRGTIMRAPKGGGPAVTLVTGQILPVRIVVDAKSIYWTTRGTHDDKGGPNNDGTVMKLAK